MAPRKRPRRAEVDTDRLKGSNEPSHGGQTSVSNRLRPLHIFSFLFVVVFFLAVSIAFYWSSPSHRIAMVPVLSVQERGLVKSDVVYREILDENARVPLNRSFRYFSNPVLAYITPWNSRGYEVAKEFTSKFTHLSPVWYELKSQGKKLFLDGRHNVDMAWMLELKKSRNALVLPRVVLEAFPADLLLKKKQWSKATDIILKECKELEYDGIVLESWSRWAHYGVLHDPDMRRMALEFIKHVGLALHSLNSIRNSSHHLELIYVIPAPRSQNLAEYDFGPQDLHQIADVVDGFSLMTYDFSGPQNPGPVAPLSWIHSSLQLLLGADNQDGPPRHASKIFLGINLYGSDFVVTGGSGMEAIIGRDYLSKLEMHRAVLRWDEKSAEHFFIYSQHNLQRAVFYPTLKSISVRLDAARSWGAGLSLWEIGQDHIYGRR
ncbi:hypothetical protein HPP92_005219 [Vanilla planifolia]|uniref:Chitinase domain-containing protein 1 n=1 Tax=Vanilla planifolia TaxID=51239 RepID=A0A835RKZ0_VANPL|nr:hypothetical protein HPP92_005515 [Vanilla planifolia]KAG0494225.1 hypothetical protein HPP92_005219 [Vanilla planifolia]